MTTLRITFYLLVAINLVCVAVIAMPSLGLESPFLGATEPERVASQVFPEKLHVLSSSTEPPGTIGAEVSAPLLEPAQESAPVAESAPAAATSSAAPETSAPVVADSGASLCVAFKNLNSTQAQALAQRARGAGSQLTVREEAAAPSSYWVNIPPQGGKPGADRRAAELKQLGLDDFFIVQDANENRFAISLGLFRAESLAQRQLETLQKKGVKGATVTARENANGARVELIGVSAQIERVARDASADIAGAVRDTCTPG
ncbi:SPOR domain-containing protein [Uliginosibacterium sp. H3]|uniref:SPOR domain-containing protein n=1 Tax=Uliginosibacterium silvisoli TaxID=3114758 RepID=A0ABU6JYH9_9RHOO|nr:SPOR domain-containing protein [Uliginosibacterium sp. H3]